MQMEKLIEEDWQNIRKLSFDLFLINPSKAKESDLYLGDISIIDGNSVAIKSWEKAVLGNVREFESNSNDIFDIIMRELENDK